MNIQEAKQTVIDTVRAYTARDEQGITGFRLCGRGLFC